MTKEGYLKFLGQLLREHYNNIRETGAQESVERLQENLIGSDIVSMRMAAVESLPWAETMIDFVY